MRGIYIIKNYPTLCYFVVDIDECKIDGIRCTQKCENKDGGYDCKCYPGYQLDADGFTCSGNKS